MDYTSNCKISSVVDSRYKSLYCKQPKKLAPNLLKFCELLNEVPTVTSPGPQPVQSQHSVTESTLATQSTGLWESLDNMMTATETNNNFVDADVSNTSALDDVKTYLKDMAIGRNVCPLTWRRQNKSLFSCHAKLPQSFLAIPETSVSSEHLNSSSGNIISIKCCCLLSQHEEELTFIHKNL